MQPSDISKLREQAFVEESLGNLGMFYKNTAASYEKRMLEETKRLNELQQVWEKRFLAAEDAFRTQKKTSLFPTFIDPVTGKPSKLFKVLDRTGKRKSFEDILKADTSRRGNVFELGQEAQQMLESTFRSDEYQQAMSSYTARYQAEQKMLEERNAKARETFLADKQKKLEQLSASAYKKPTYTEKPL